MWRDSFFFSLLVLCLSVDYAQPAKWEKGNNEFDLLIFTQQWPITVCREWQQHNKSHTCTMPQDKDTWTIHGIWPTKLHTLTPSFCNKSWVFDPEQVRPIEAELSRLWTNIEAVPLKYNLWSHEWSKHGTCAAVLEPLNNEFKYFSKGLEWMEQISMTNLLGHFVPSNEKTYNLIDIHDIIKTGTQVNPAIECRRFDGKNWLVEIRVCFNKTLHFADCDGVKGFHAYKIGTPENETSIITNCEGQDIFYPKDLVPPNKLIVQFYKLISWFQWFTL